jgi:hypothetical protein
MTTESFPLDTILYRFNGVEPFTLRQACEGVQIFGGIGSGKTSGSGAALAKSYLRAGFGGLVLCAKKDELETWQRYAQETGRENSLLVFDASGEWRFPFLQYEVSREGEGAGYTENLVRLFTTVQEAIERGSGGGGSDPYWQRAMQQLMRNAIDLSMLARGEVSVPLLSQIINSAPTDTEERDSEAWKEKSICWQLLLEGNARQMKGELDEWQRQDLSSTLSFWLEEFVKLAPKTRSGIVSMFTSMADNFMRRPFRMLFSEPSPKNQNALPELTHQGIVIVMNLPVKEFGEAGRAAQLVYKYMWQQAAERRNIKESDRPLFLWVDEAQNFASEYDMQFQATARSSRACTVYLTQNLPNYYAEMGGAHSKYRVDSLVGNLQTKIWHANSEPETNNRASEIIGKSWQVRRSQSTNMGKESFSMGESEQESYDFDVIPQAFTRLRKGSPANNFEVDAIIFQSGRVWSNGRTFYPAIFDQRAT